MDEDASVLFAATENVAVAGAFTLILTGCEVKDTTGCVTFNTATLEFVTKVPDTALQEY